MHNWLQVVNDEHADTAKGDNSFVYFRFQSYFRFVQPEQFESCHAEGLHWINSGWNKSYAYDHPIIIISFKNKAFLNFNAPSDRIHFLGMTRNLCQSSIN